MKNKTEIRVERDFVKKANDCSNCIHHQRNIDGASKCNLDGFATQKQSWCKSHELKEVK